MNQIKFRSTYVSVIENFQPRCKILFIVKIPHDKNRDYENIICSYLYCSNRVKERLRDVILQLTKLKICHWVRRTY